MASEDNEAKLTEEMRAVITNIHFENDVLSSANAVSEEIAQEDYEGSTADVEPEEDTYIETAKPENVKPAQAKIRKSKRKHSDAREKSLLLEHHSAIKDLTKQVNQMRSKLATIESKKSAAKKKVNHTTSKKSKRIRKKSIKKR